jgi:hypothetical protein
VARSAQRDEVVDLPLETYMSEADEGQ